jgi:hypothetical protein
MIKKFVFEYYHRVNNCEANKSTDKMCICWHAEGTGPSPNQKHTDDVPLVVWRIAK